MREQVEKMILNRQKTTLATAFAIANDKSLAEGISSNSIENSSYDELISKFIENELYKNSWMQILDKDLQSIYVSSNGQNGAVSNQNREDLLEASTLKKPLISVSIGEGDFGIRAIVPIIKNSALVGLVELSSRFDAISKQMKDIGVDSIVVLSKEYKNTLKNHLSKNFIDDYYVANIDASVVLMEYLRKNGVHNYIHTPQKFENHYIISTYPLKNIQNIVIGHYIMFKKRDDVLNINLDFFMYKWIGIAIVAFMIMMAVLGSFLHYRNKKQKMYYKNIIDSSSNIVMVVDKDNIINMNKTFFKYFNDYDTLEAFKAEHQSISDFFVKEEGCIYKDMDGVNWLEYLIKNPKNSLVKILYNEKEYYFTVGVSLISEEDAHYSAIFSNITDEKIYQKELEHTNITDPLTKIRNRYCYNKQIKKECASSNRYFYPLSLVIFDMDNFKNINDNYGHDVGDKVLIEYTKLITTCLRDSDIFCRIGGEEFALILPHVNKSDAYKLADKIRSKVQEHNQIVAITMSFGVTEYKKDEDLELTFKRADKALYEAKNAGRNRVVAI
ncbi:diguanylate cyclase (GGDEF domain) [Sulfurimonas denitrificans DSM 1251]|uniref:diguanylate cyclase n=1 Tax=Sulfurimonas denitrificans (strain ATCC 33889 / DSM 1251) TaxID=326298 RepID=Q30PB2_SULDN|nr:diguanylate cyclase [Sulfurimonas denitrificans]ABB45169.1 diguanylate cyclase (GGDEF domain) [Sulfurimonas denitrificans DSM 1251]MDD3442764.1 diguanylate cyclase [Sulfurimonas denitrificans]